MADPIPRTMIADIAMSADIHAARPEEAEAVLETLSLAFGLDRDAARPVFYSDPFYDLAHKRVLSLPGIGIVSCLTIVPAVVRIGGVSVRAGGIAGVATRPAFQRRGHAAALLAATLPALRTEFGFPLSLLHPISAPFYQKFGWEHASSHVRWLSAPASLPRHDATGGIRPATDRDWPAIQRIYAEKTQADTGAFARDLRRWQLIRMPFPGREVFVYEAHGEVDGYGVWERHDVLHVLEMLGRTENAQLGLIGHLARQPDALAEWDVSPALLRQLGLSAAGLSPESGVMLRLVDLENALAALHPAHYAPVLAEFGTTLTLHAADLRCPQNAHPLRLTPNGVVPDTYGGGPWLRADIHILAPLYFGHLLPSDAAEDGCLSVDSPQTLALADRLFPRREPYVAPLDQF